MCEAMLRRPSGSQAAPLGNSLEIHDPSDQEIDRLNIEVDETSCLLQNQQDRLLVAFPNSNSGRDGGNGGEQSHCPIR